MTTKIAVYSASSPRVADPKIKAEMIRIFESPQYEMHRWSYDLPDTVVPDWSRKTCFGPYDTTYFTTGTGHVVAHIMPTKIWVPIQISLELGNLGRWVADPVVHTALNISFEKKGMWFDIDLPEPMQKRLRGTDRAASGMRSSLIKLAHSNPELRPHLLPLLTASTGKTASTYAEYEKRKEDAGEKALSQEDWKSRTEKIKHHDDMKKHHLSKMEEAKGKKNHPSADAHGNAFMAHRQAANLLREDLHGEDNPNTMYMGPDKHGWSERASKAADKHSENLKGR